MNQSSLVGSWRAKPLCGRFKGEGAADEGIAEVERDQDERDERETPTVHSVQGKAGSVPATHDS